MSNLTPEELAEELNLPLDWIKRRVGRKELPHERYGNHTRFTPAHVEAIRKAHAVAVKDAPANPYGHKTRGAK